MATVTGVHWPPVTSRRRRFSKVRRPAFVGQSCFSRTSRAGAPDKISIGQGPSCLCHIRRQVCGRGTGRGCGISSERSIRAGRLPAAARLRGLAVVQLCPDLTCRKERSRRPRGLLSPGTTKRKYLGQVIGSGVKQADQGDARVSKNVTWAHYPRLMLDRYQQIPQLAAHIATPPPPPRGSHRRCSRGNEGDSPPRSILNTKVGG